MWNIVPDNGLLLAACSAFIPTISGQTSACLLVEPENASSVLTEPAETVGEKEELGLPWLRSCTQWECIYISAAQCESHYRPPTFMALVERCRASRGESWLERPLPSPPPVLLAAQSRWRRSTAPTLLASLCQVLQLESSWADRGYMVLQQSSRLKTPAEGSLPLVYSKGKQFEPQLTILLISRNNLTSQMELLWNLSGLFEKFSW